MVHHKQRRGPGCMEVRDEAGGNKTKSEPPSGDMGSHSGCSAGPDGVRLESWDSSVTAVGRSARRGQDGGALGHGDKG